MTSNLKAWFLPTEAQFTLRKITVDRTKFGHVVAALDLSVAASCTTILAKATGIKYAHPKKALTDRFQ